MTNNNAVGHQRLTWTLRRSRVSSTWATLKALTHSRSSKWALRLAWIRVEDGLRGGAGMMAWKGPFYVENRAKAGLFEDQEGEGRGVDGYGRAPGSKLRPRQGTRY